MSNQPYSQHGQYNDAIADQFAELTGRLEAAENRIAALEPQPSVPAPNPEGDQS